MVYHALLFCFACMIWTKTKINYKFVLEFNTRHTLDWRQLLMVCPTLPLHTRFISTKSDSIHEQFVSIFGFLLGLVVFLNFRVESDMFLYWPVLLTGLSILILFFPAPYLYHHARWWWAQKNVCPDAIPCAKLCILTITVRFVFARHTPCLLPRFLLG